MTINTDDREALHSATDPQAAMFRLLESGVADGVFPGCVALVCKDGAIVYEEAHGTIATHAAVPLRADPVRRSTIYDLASLTKVLATTTLVAIAVTQGRLALKDDVPSPWNTACPGARLVDLLEHCAGLEAHREYFAEVEPFDRDAVVRRVCETPPAYRRGECAVYSDLGFIILGAWLERIFDSPLDDVFTDRVAYPLGLEDSPLPKLGFRRLCLPAVLPIRKLEKLIAPTEVYDPALHPKGVPSHLNVRNHLPYAHGAVHDDNAYVMGGVAGHAGLFGTAEGVLELAQGWLQLLLPELDETVRDRFWQPSAVPGSTRRLGWDGPARDGSSSAGRRLSPQAVGHTGYTGTSLWIDPAAAGGARVFVLLTNRVHPTRDNDGIKRFRPRFHDLAMQL